MPPRGHHSYQLPASQTNGQGRRKPAVSPGMPGEAPGSTGFGLTPQNVDAFYNNPKNDPNNNFRGSWQAARDSAYLGAQQSYEAQQKAYASKIAEMRVRAVDLAKRYNERAQALIAASKGIRNPTNDRIAEYYGIDASTREGQRAAGEWAMHLQDLANKSNTDQGVEQLVTFHDKVKGAIGSARHKSFLKEQQALNAQANPGVADFGGAVLGTGLGALETITEPLQRAYYAAKYSQLRGGSGAEQYKSFIGGLPGLGFINPGGTQERKNVEATNTRGERDVLTEHGQLISVGQAIVGDYAGLSDSKRRLAENSSFLHGAGVSTETIDRYSRSMADVTTFEINGNKVNLASGTLDAAIAIGSDPTLAAGKALGAAKGIGFSIEQTIRAGAAKAARSTGEKVTEEALAATVRAARYHFIENTAVGSGVLGETLRGIERYGVGSVDNITKILGKNTTRALASKISEAGLVGGPAAAREVLIDAFAKGVWHPERSLVSRAVAASSIEAVAKPSRLPKITEVLLNRINTTKLADDVVNPTTGEVVARAGERIIRAPLRATGPHAVDNVLKWSVEHAAIANKEFGGRLLDRFANEGAVDYASRAVALRRATEAIGNDGFTHAVDVILKPLQTKTFDQLTKLEQETLINHLRFAEATASILAGGAGDGVQKTVQDQFLRQFSIAPETDLATNAVARAVSDIRGLAWDSTTYRKIDPDIVKAVLSDLPEGDLKTKLLAELDEAAPGSAKFGQTAQAVDIITHSETALEDATRYIELHGNRTALADVFASSRLTDGASMFARALSGSSRMLTSLMEKAPGSVLRTAASPFLGENQRGVAQFMDRYAGAIGLNLQERRAIAAEAERVAERVAAGGTPAAALDFHQSLVELAFEKSGLSRQTAQEWAAEFRKEFTRTDAPEQAFGLALKEGVDPAGKLDAADFELLNRPQIASQAASTFTVPDIERVMAGIRKELELEQKGSVWNHVRVDWDKTKERAIITRADGRTFTIADGFHKAHKLWKVMVTTRMYLPILAFGANFAATGDFWQSLAIGSVAGGFGFVRYKTRLTLQNRLDAVLEHGFTPREWIPGYGRVLRHQDAPSYGSGVNALFPDPEVASWIEGRVGHYTRAGADLWEVATPNGGKQALQDFVEAYHRVLNFQINPETDEVMRLMLERKAGRLTEGQLDGALDDFFHGKGAYEGADDGALWLEKNKGIGAKTAKQAKERYRQFVDQYVPDSEIAHMRLDPNEAFGPGLQITHDQIRELLDKGLLADAVHFQASRSILKDGPFGVFKAWKRFYEAAAYDSSRSASFRETFFAVERRKQLSSLKAVGVPETEALEIAGELATRRTNELMFRYDNVSRFAHKVDWIAPFTGHRLFNITTWSRLALENPGRTIRIAYRGAQAFNVAAENGIFHKDPYGTWQMTIPGSAWLSKQIGIGPTNFDVSLTGFFALSGELSRGSDHFGPLGTVIDAVSPHPGGLWWAGANAAIREVAPDLVNPEKSALPHELLSFLYPYGPSAGLMTPEAARYLRVMVGTGGPWSMLDDDQGTEDVNKWEVRVAKDLIAEHRRQDPTDLTWFPSDEAVKERTLALFNVWSFMTTVSPAAPHPRFQNEQKFQELWTNWLGPLAGTDLTGPMYSQLRKSFVNRFPAYAPFLDSSGKWVGDSPEEWQHSTKTKTSEDYQIAAFSKRRRQMALGEYRDSFRKFRQDEAANKAFHDAMEVPNAIEREKALQKYRHDFPDQAANYRLRQHAEADLARILAEYPPSQKEAAIERWRHDWAPKGTTTISRGTYLGMRANIERVKAEQGSEYKLNPWKRARETEDVWKDATRTTGTNVVVRRDGSINPAFVWYAASLGNPAEQVKLWQEAALKLSENTQFATSDPAKYIDAWNAIKRKISDVYSVSGDQLHTAPPKRATLYSTNDHNLYRGMLQKQAAASQATLSGMYEQANQLKVAQDRAYASKQYATGRALKEQRDALFDQIKEYKNGLWANRPESQEMHDAVRELTYFNSIEAPATVISEAWARVQAASTTPFAPTNEEAHYLAMPNSVRAAYINEMVIQLNTPAGQGSARFNINASDAVSLDADGVGGGFGGTDYKMYWSYLTDFQRSLLTNNLPAATTDGWAALDKGTEEARAKAGSGGGGRGRGGSDISWAYAQMKKYSKRGGMAKPAAYAEFLALGNNPAARNQFLEQHPEVADYVKAGPMANMPPVIQMMVQNIMIQNGRWDGEARDIHDLTDIAFAREQLQRYNKRTGPAPQTYDLWLNMPSGQAKADYLTAHPEIKAWLQLGPMANMPEIYRDVVRDIMYRYHEWTATTDGMGDVLSGYYRTPSYARNKYLAEHPELAAYWAATRSPQDEAIGQLVDAYYASPDPGAKAGMLSAHPELKEYFLNSRTRRYERFLSQVAQFMGSNPDLFQHYLDNQQQVLNDLLNKFAAPNLAREEHWLKPTKTSTKSTESGRQRR